MEEYVLNQWKLGKYDEKNVANCVKKNYITQEQAIKILSTPQIERSEQNGH